MKLRKIFSKQKEKKNGFTLVELIVVLVILAILAAIMVPTLIGWIDKAKEKQAVLRANNLYKAAQAVASEWYAEGKSSPDEPGNSYTFSEDVLELAGIQKTTESKNFILAHIFFDNFTVVAVYYKEFGSGIDLYWTQNSNWTQDNSDFPHLTKYADIMNWSYP